MEDGTRWAVSRQRLGRWLVVGIVGVLLGWFTPTIALAQEPGPHRAGLVVVGAEGQVMTYCVAFAEERLTGVALLEQAAVAPVFQDSAGGTAVCTIQGTGCPASDCFCSCKGTPCQYWSYFHRNADATWAYSGVGAAAWDLGDGDVDAWVWGDGSQTLPALSWEAICPAGERVGAVANAVVAPTATLTPTVQVFLPGASTGGSATVPPRRSLIPPALQLWAERYGSFVLLLLALIAFVLVRRSSRRGAQR